MNLEDVVHQWHAAQPHPLAPSVTQGDFPVAMRLSTMLKYGTGHASPSEAANFWHEYTTMNQTLQATGKLPLGPEEFVHVAQQMARSSFAYHNRPPSMYEIQRMRDASPKEVSDYYGSMPDEHYPTVSAADMAKAMHAARPWAMEYIGRGPNKLEGAYLASSGHNPADYYQKVASGRENQPGGHTGVAGAANAGGQQNGQRAPDSGVAPGNAPTGGAEGVPAR